MTTLPAEACRAMLERGKPGVFLLDTLNLADSLTFPERRPGQSVVLIVHHLPSLEPGLEPEAEAIRIERAALPQFDGFLSTSPFTTDVLLQRGIALESIVTIPPAPPRVESPPRRYRGPLRALLVANLIARKGVLEWLRAVAARANDREPFSIEIVGRDDIEPAYAQACRAFVSTAEHLQQRVRFVGAVPHREMAEHYRDAGVLVSAAEMETFGMALQEARAWGRPILALDRAHVSAHFTNGENGFLFSSHESLAEGFLDLARSNEKMARLFEHAARTALKSDYTWATAAERLLAGLERIHALAP